MVNHSGTRFHFKLYLIDGQTVDVTTSVGNALAWEKVHGRSWAPSGNASPEISQLMWVAWAAAKGKGLTDVGRFDDFAALIDDFELIDDGDDGLEDPTRTEDSASSSSS